MADDVNVSTVLISALVALGSSLLTIFLTPKIQHHFWKYQRRDEVRLAAINEFNRLTNAYIAACLVPNEPRPPLSEWLRDFNVAAATIRALFSDSAYSGAREVSDMFVPYAEWEGINKKQRAHKFADARDEALTPLYREVIPLRKAGTVLHHDG